MSIKNWFMIIAMSGLMASLAFAQDATSEPTSPRSQEQVNNARAKTPQEWCDEALAPEPETRQFEDVPIVTTLGVDYRAILCTETGAVYVDLYEDMAPKAVNNFVFLTQQGFYNNQVFDPVANSIIPIQTESPGYQFEDEVVAFVTFDRPGLLAMNNEGAADTNGSQFFITTAVTDFLTYSHTIFGEVIEGYLSVEDIEERASDEPLKTVLIVTNNATVNSTYESAEVQLADTDDFGVRFFTMIDRMPPGFELGDKGPTATLDEVIARLPDNQQDAAETFYKAHNYQYRAELSMLNFECNPDYFFTTFTYSVDAYATSEDATEALTDPTLEELAIAEGYSREPGFTPVFSRSAKDCTGAETQEGRLYLQRGPYIVIAEAIIAKSVVDRDSIETFLNRAIVPFEKALEDIYFYVR